MSGGITVTGSSSSPAGSRSIGPLTLIGPNPVDATSDLILASGDNVVSVPSGAVAVIIYPPVTNAVALKLRTSANGSDAGLPLGPIGPTVLPLASGVTSITINAASTLTALTEVVFI